MQNRFNPIYIIGMIAVVVVGIIWFGGGDDDTAQPIVTEEPILVTPTPFVAQQTSAVRIELGQDAQTIIEQHPAGTTFTFESGIHRMQSISPRNGDTFTGEPGAVLNGSRRLQGFQRQGNLWFVGGQTQQGDVLDIDWDQPFCQPGYERCIYPEELYIDHEPLIHVASLGEVRPGTWYFEYGTDRIYIGDDPNGRLIETSVTTLAFRNTADNVTIRDLTVEKYANPAQVGAILGFERSGWLIQNVTTQLNHGPGIGLGEGMRVLNNRILNNGQIGLSSQGDNALIQGNEIAHNNFAKFSPFWEAGGAKLVGTENIVIRNNYVYNNGGPGLWLDIDNYNALIEDNIVVNNRRIGIYHEIGYAVIIRNNVVKFNNVADMPGVYGAQIQINTSQDTEIYDNTVVVSQDGGNGIGIVQEQRGTGERGEWVARNNYVHSNTIIYMGASGASGVQLNDDSATTFWQDSNNRFNNNRYFVRSDDGFHWMWENVNQAWESLRAYGQESTGTLTVGIPAAAASIPAWEPDAAS